MKVFFSNRLEILADRLRERLMQGRPFAKRWVIVPSLALKNYLMMRFAMNLGIAAGVKIMTLGQALREFFPDDPTQIELSLMIEDAIRHLDQTECQPLFSYLEKGEAHHLTSLCDELAYLFLRHRTCDSWQQTIWNRVFTKNTEKKVDFPIFLFHFTFLPQAQLEFFKKANAEAFFLSPSEMFWGDLYSPKEQAYLLGKAKEPVKEELAHYFEGQNRLIANLGKMGRNFFNVLENEEIEELYEAPEGDTFLSRLQQGMLELNSEEISSDDSVQVHAAPSKSREVEIIREILTGLNSQSALVLAPDITEYAPHIHRVFGSKETPFDYAILDLELESENLLAQGLHLLLEIPRKKYDVNSIFKLLSHSPFLEKFKFSREDAALIRKWMRAANIRFGWNSWVDGFDRLIFSLACLPEEEGPFLDFSDAPLLSKWLEVMHQIKEKLAIVESTMCCKDWMRSFKDLVSTFFALGPDYESLVREFEGFAKAADLEFNFESMRRVLSSIFSKRTGSFHGACLNAVRFGTLGKGSLVPADVICLMGMEDGKFPRSEKLHSLKPSESAYLPTAAEEDRYLFLEALLAARKTLVISYCKEEGPSLVVEELKIPAQEHPRLPFHEKSHFQENYLAAKAYFSSDKKPLTPFLPSFYSSAPLEKKERPAQITVDIRHLRLLARHPIQFYFERVLGIYFEREDHHHPEFELSSLDLWKFRRDSLKKDVSAILKDTEISGKLPLGPFKGAAVQKIKDEIEEYQENLETLNVGEVFSKEVRLEIPLANERKAVVVGRLDDLTSEGYLFHGDDWVRAWPLFLVSLNLGLPQRLLLTKKGKVSEYSIQDPQAALARYLDYYETALENVSPLMPQWTRAFFEGDFGKVMRGRTEDPILKWLFERDSYPNATVVQERWSSYLREVLHEAL